MIRVLTDDPTLANDATAKNDVGELFTYRHSTYGRWLLRYVQFKDAVTYAAGQVVLYANTTRTAVTNDCSGGSAIGIIPAGIALLAMTTAYYGFVLVNGYYPSIKTSGADDIAVGESLIAHATTDGTCDGVAAGSTTTASFGIAVAADDDTANTVAGFVNIL